MVDYFTDQYRPVYRMRIFERPVVAGKTVQPQSRTILDHQGISYRWYFHTGALVAA